MKFEIEGEQYYMQFSYEKVVNKHGNTVMSTILCIKKNVEDDECIAAANIVQKHGEQHCKEKARRYVIAKALKNSEFFTVSEEKDITGKYSVILKAKRTAVWNAYNNRNSKNEPIPVKLSIQDRNHWI